MNLTQNKESSMMCVWLFMALFCAGKKEKIDANIERQLWEGKYCVEWDLEEKKL